VFWGFGVFWDASGFVCVLCFWGGLGCWGFLVFRGLGVLGFRVFGGFECLEVLWCLGVTVKRLRF